MQALQVAALRCGWRWGAKMRRRIWPDRFAPASLLIVIATLGLTLLSATLASAQDEDADPSGSAQDIDVNRPPTDWEKAFTDFLARWFREHPNATDADFFEAQAQWMRDNPDPDFAARQAAEAAALDAAFAEAMTRPPPDIGDWMEPVDPLAEALAKAGRWEDARAFYGRYPPGTRASAMALVKLSELTEWADDDFDDLPVLREAFATLLHLDPDDRNLFYVIRRFSGALRRSGLGSLATIKTYRDILGADHPLLIRVLEGEALSAGLDQSGMQRIDGTPEGCRASNDLRVALYEEALGIARRIMEPDDLNLTYSLSFLASAKTTQGASDEAVALYEEAREIAALYVAPIYSIDILSELGEAQARLKQWPEAQSAFLEGLEMLAEAETEGALTADNKLSMAYRLNRGLGNALHRTGRLAEASLAYASAMPGLPIVVCFERDPAGGPTYAWGCRGFHEIAACNEPTILDDVQFLEDRATVLASAAGRPAAATRLAWFASHAVVSDTRDRYTLEPRGRSDYQRLSHTHRTFVSTAWSAAARP